MNKRIAFLWIALEGNIGSGNTNHIRNWLVGLKKNSIEFFNPSYLILIYNIKLF